VLRARRSAGGPAVRSAASEHAEAAVRRPNPRTSIPSPLPDRSLKRPLKPIGARALGEYPPERLLPVNRDR